MKALEKDRNRRYETANSFADDIQRYLNDEAVQACPPSAMYRFRKFARRNKAALVMAMLVGSAILIAVAGLAVSTVLIAREQRATENALQAETQAKADLQDTLERERRDSYFHRIALAHRELSVDNLDGALQLLGECPEDLREWEWYYLMRLCRVEPVVLRDKTEVNGVAFSPDGERLASAGEDGDRQDLEQQDGQSDPDDSQAHRITDSVVQRRVPPRRQAPGLPGADQKVKVWDLTATGQPCSPNRATPFASLGRHIPWHSVPTADSSRREVTGW